MPLTNPTKTSGTDDLLALIDLVPVEDIDSAEENMEHTFGPENLAFPRDEYHPIGVGVKRNVPCNETSHSSIGHDQNVSISPAVTRNDGEDKIHQE